jgi:hypothetical protein
MEAGVTLARWFGNEAKRVFSIRGESKEDAELRTLVDWIERHGGAATDREIAKGPAAFRKDAKKRADALKSLEDSGVGSWRITDTDGRQRHEFAITKAVGLSPQNPAAAAAEPQASKTRELVASAASSSSESPAKWGVEL